MSNIYPAEAVYLLEASYRKNVLANGGEMQEADRLAVRSYTLDSLYAIASDEKYGEIDLELTAKEIYKTFSIGKLSDIGNIVCLTIENNIYHIEKSKIEEYHAPEELKIEEENVPRWVRGIRLTKHAEEIVDRMIKDLNDKGITL